MMVRMALGWIALVVVMPAVRADVVRSAMRLSEGRQAYVQHGVGALWSDLASRPGLLYREAESADALAFLPGHQVVADDLCGGGAMIEQVEEARFDLAIASAGRYHGWARLWLPRPGSWTHEESFDGGGRRTIRDSARWVFGSWLWSPLGDYELKAGAQTFTLHGWRGGARLDAILFSADPDFDPSTIAGIPTAGAADRGHISTVDIGPSAVTAWRRLEIAVDLQGGECQAEVSTDGGRTWLPAPGGDLSAVPARGDGHDRLRARLELRPGADGASPRVRGVTVAYDLPADAEAVVSTPRYRVAFARRTGALAGLSNLETGVDVTPPHLQEPCLGLALREPGATELLEVTPEEVLFQGLDESSGGLTLRWLAARDIELRLEVTPDGGELSTWLLGVHNRSALEVVRIDFPLIREAALGDCRDDEAVLPRTGGWRIRNPASSKTWMTTYLGGGSMSWMDLWDASGGLYLVMQDPTLRSTELSCSPAASRQAVDLSFRTHTLVRPGAQCERRFQVGLHRGDWHWAADRYREWAATWLKPPQPPAWLRDCDGWVGLLGAPFAAMPAKLAQAQREGFDYLQYWSQMADGIDQCCGNFYWPAPALGGAEGFTSGIGKVRQAGGKVTGYMNCQTWTRDSWTNELLRRTPRADLPAQAQELLRPLEWFERWRLYPLDGQPLGYYADTLGWYIMCPASTGFSEHLRFWMADMYGGLFRTDGVYLDQAGATQAKPCYNLDHGHDDIGSWGAGMVEMLRQVREAGRRINPDYLIAIEGCGDALGQYADLHLISGLCTHPEVYHYTFPDHILISGLSNNSPLNRHQRVSRAFLNGDRFDSRLHDAGMIAAVRLRQRVKAWLYPGRFMDTVGLEVSDEAVLARWNLCELPGERAIVVAFDNESARADAHATLALPAGWEQPRHLYLFGLGGEVVAMRPTVAAGKIRIPVIASTLSAALLVYETTPARQVDLFQRDLAQPGQTALQIAAVNLGTADVTIAVETTPEAPLTGGAGRLTLSVPAGGTSAWQVEPGPLDGLQQPARLRINATWPGGQRQAWAEVRPFFLNSRLILDADEDGKPDYWQAGGTTAAVEHGLEDGAVVVVGKPKEFQYLNQHVTLEPRTTYRFAGWIRRSAPSAQVSIAVVEFIGERGLRVHRLGDDETAPADTWQRFEKTFTTGGDFRASAVYLYNVHSEVKAWYRDLELEKVP
ncbi:MAG: hypothetical protein GX595_01730 [Lentisphaerae bacterium]|nr:hypothetical protein [Lentisphaerota bacterium]